jgi:hypothetical protein
MARVTARKRKNLVATSNANSTTAMTLPWMILFGASTLRAWMEFRQITANMRLKFRYRTAAVTPKRPGAWTTSTVERSANGQIVEDTTVSGITDQLWVQVAIASATASSGQVGEVTAALQAQLDGEAAIVAGGGVQVEPSVNASQNAYYPIGGLFSALGLAGVMVALIVTGVSGTLDYGIAIRYFDGDENEPGAWTDLVNWTGITADEFRNSGDQATTPGTKMFAQLGIKVPAGTNPRATIKAIAAARWS